MPTVDNFDIAYGPVSCTLVRTIWMAGEGEQSYEAARMRVEVTNAVGIQSQLFVWRRFMYTQDELSANPPVLDKDLFTCVAKIADFSVYPVDAPAAAPEEDGGTYLPLYRLSYMDAPFSSPLDLLSTWNMLLSHVYTLMEMRVKLGYVTP